MLLLWLGACQPAPSGKDDPTPGDTSLADCYDAGAPAPGEACVTSLGSAHAKLLAEAPGDKAGYSMAGLGDMDADGSDDLLVGARFSGEAGVAYVVGGPLSGDVSLSTSTATVHGAGALDEFGGRVASAGDLNGDSVVDVLISALALDENGEDSGGVYVFYGPLTGDVPASAADGFFWGEGEGDRAGDSLAGLGDVDGDGVSDVLVGASNADLAAEKDGGAYLLLGPASGAASLADAHARLLGGAPFATAGNSVAALGDINGDGLADLAVGTPHRDSGGVETPGLTHVMLGPVSGTLYLQDADGILTGEQQLNRAGIDLAGGSDINGDGLPDLAVGAHSWGEGEPGAAYIVWGPATGESALADAPVRFYGEAPGGWVGVRLDFVGDLDANGSVDLGVGAKFYSEVAEDAGATYTCFGPFGLGSHSVDACDLLLLGEAGGDESGMDIALGGDLTGDGLDDMVVGAAGEATLGENGGAAYVIALGPR